MVRSKHRKGSKERYLLGQITTNGKEASTVRSKQIKCTKERYLLGQITTNEKEASTVRSKRIKGSKERYLLGQNKHANCRCNPLYRATKRHLNNN